VTGSELTAHAEALVAEWPDLTSEQIDRLALIFRPAQRAA
jgi:hypothetical protein